jgi:hypothetical protein
VLTRTLAQFRAGVRRLAEAESKTARHPNADVDVFINASIAALREFISDNGHHYHLDAATGTLARGANTIALPADFQRLYAVSLGDGCEHDLTDWTFQDRDLYRNRRAGLPMVFRIISDHIRVYPVSDAAYTYTLEYLPHFTPLVNVGDTFAGMPDWFEWIELDAAENIYIKDKDVARQAMAAQRKALIEERIRKHAPRRSRARVLRRRDTRSAACAPCETENVAAAAVDDDEELLMTIESHVDFGYLTLSAGGASNVSGSYQSAFDVGAGVISAQCEFDASRFPATLAGLARKVYLEMRWIAVQTASGTATSFEVKLIRNVAESTTDVTGTEQSFDANGPESITPQYYFLGPLPVGASLGDVLDGRASYTLRGKYTGGAPGEEELQLAYARFVVRYE